jgi:hypothetical protein
MYPTQHAIGSLASEHGHNTFAAESGRAGRPQGDERPPFGGAVE